MEAVDVAATFAAAQQKLNRKHFNALTAEQHLPR